MDSPRQSFSTEELGFIRGRGTLFAEGSSSWDEAEAKEMFADGWSIVANMLNMKAYSEAESRKAGQIFADAAWAEWYRQRPGNDD